MGRQGGARRGRSSALAARPSACARARPPGRPLASSSSPSAPLPLVALLKREAWKEGDAPLPGAPLPGRGCWRERAREYGKRGYMRERTAEGERGRESVTLEPPEPCLQRVMRVRVRACARVCSGGGGGGVPGVLQHQTAPHGGKRIRNDGTTADPTLNPSPAGAQPAHPPPGAQRLLPGLGAGICRRPLRGEAAAQPVLRPGRGALRPAWRSQKRLS